VFVPPQEIVIAEVASAKTSLKRKDVRIMNTSRGRDEKDDDDGTQLDRVNRAEPAAAGAHTKSGGVEASPSSSEKDNFSYYLRSSFPKSGQALSGSGKFWDFFLRGLGRYRAPAPAAEFRATTAD
jgi:hypothetical protein